MLGLFRQQAKYEAIEVKPSLYAVRFRVGTWPFFRWEYAVDEKNRGIIMELPYAKSFLREIDIYYYEDFQVVSLENEE